MNRGNAIFRKPKKQLPKTIRYCLFCQRDTTFEFDRNVFHSRCSECGGMISSKIRENKNA